MLHYQFIEGFILGLGLLVALGPKDAFVIKNNLTSGHSIILILICFLSDVVLIVLGVVGLGAIITKNHGVMALTMSVSIMYLLYFGIQALRSVFAGHTLRHTQVEHQVLTRPQVIQGALFHSLLSPFAWLDTVLVIGSISAIQIGVNKYFFAGGAMLASLMWFIALTVGSRLSASAFRNARVWQGLDSVVAVSMFAMAAKLLADYPWK